MPRLFYLVFTAVLFVMSPVFAGEEKPSIEQKTDKKSSEKTEKIVEGEEWWRGTVTLQMENDLFAGTDRHYTHGTRISWVSDKTNEGMDWVRDILSPFYFWGVIDRGRVGFALGQNIYTPENIEATTLQTDDRPYAGWLYGEISAYVHSRHKILDHQIDALDSLSLSLGVVGPAAFGGEAQNLVHDIRNIPRANGWDNQLKNEPAINLMVERKWRPNSWTVGPVEWDFIPHVGASLGNVFTMASGGLTIRLGQALDEDYGPPNIRPSFSGLAAIDDKAACAWYRLCSWYVFAGAEGRGVLHNIFLDGNTFTDSHSVDKKPFVGNIQLGIAARIGAVRLAYTQVFLSKEFDGQKEHDRYGVLSAAINF